MASADQYYPTELNPFGDEDDESGTQKKTDNPIQQEKTDNDYPVYLSPFSEDEIGLRISNVSTIDDYDDSLNPFGDEESTVNQRDAKESNDIDETNPFSGDSVESDTTGQAIQIDAKVSETARVNTPPRSFESLDTPPVPLPRTKSLLKKEHAKNNRQELINQQPEASESNQTHSLHSNISSTSSSSMITVSKSPQGSIQRRKTKRNAPPVPVNFKRQVSGSLDAIEEELNDIGDKLANIEQKSNLCQQSLKNQDTVNKDEFDDACSEFIELIKKKNSIVRRQKELMYKKREIKLDQIHSDIEYELRMIANKQLSHKTSDDEAREKDLLKKLVEIVEEKSDIIENLNKDTSCDSQEIEKALRRLNIVVNEDTKRCDEIQEVAEIKTSILPIKKGNCDKNSTAMGVKLSKIATLLPKGGTLRDTMKIKRKRLFKKRDSRSVDC